MALCAGSQRKEEVRNKRSCNTNSRQSLIFSPAGADDTVGRQLATDLTRPFGSFQWFAVDDVRVSSPGSLSS